MWRRNESTLLVVDRLRRMTINTTTATTTTTNKTMTTSPSTDLATGAGHFGRVGQLLGVGGPLGAIRPDLALPYGNGDLESIDREAGGDERLCPVWRRHGGDHGALTELEAADSMHQHQSPDHRPTRTRFGRDLCEFGNDHLVVCLVLQPPHVGAALGVVANRAAEEHHRPAIGPHAPLVELADRQRGIGETEPIVAVNGREHIAHRSRAPSVRDARTSAMIVTISLSWAHHLFRRTSEPGVTRPSSRRRSGSRSTTPLRTDRPAALRSRPGRSGWWRSAS